ncbi:hypothetical protein [Lysinibacillus xylanilyticus]|uniref:hypothetical protein n=1 Tax=Lysinibacillus xylanilyticus TaxID=582475 RepID=UPI003D03339B
MTKKEIAVTLILTVLVGLVLQMYSSEINLIAPIIKKNLFEISVLGGIITIITMLAPFGNKQ